MEQTIRQSEKLRALGELAGGVAHDFNNILAAILGRAQLLKMGIAPPPGIEEKRASALELRKGLDIIERAAKDGAETVRRIQAFSRKRTDDSLFTEIDINELLEHSLEFTKVRWKGEAETKGIHFTIQKEFSSLPLVTGSSSELREVFVNLINNAIDAMPQGGKITIKTFRKDNDLAIVIEDTGAGIPKAIRDRIFEPFFTTKGPQSTGLGMSVSYGIIDRHRGTISVESEEGQGATFTITLPIAEERLEEEKIHTRMAEQKKATILVIEDEEHISALLYDILIKGGHEVETASDGSKGIETFKKKAFDLVFTDLNMVGISGWEVAEKVKSINGRVPVVLITGWNIKLEEKKIKDKWVDLVIQKPFEVDQVLKVVQQGVILREQFKKV
jgi:CheY-like chemotaxis protein/anti-sigma regulatory factor (Ser/Thr protein kinase)